MITSFEKCSTVILASEKNWCTHSSRTCCFKLGVLQLFIFESNVGVCVGSERNILQVA